MLMWALESTEQTLAHPVPLLILLFNILKYDLKNSFRKFLTKPVVENRKVERDSKKNGKNKIGVFEGPFLVILKLKSLPPPTHGEEYIFSPRPLIACPPLPPPPPEG
jgi:hypothetical protein